MLNRLEEFDSQNLQEYVTPPRIRLMGVGGAGNNILRNVVRGGLQAARLSIPGRRKKKKKKRAKPPRLEPVMAAPTAQPVVELASPPTDIQPDMVIEMDMESVAPIAPAAQPVVELVSPPQIQPLAGSAPAQPTDWQKRSEKPLVDIHRRLDSMLEEDSQSLEERPQGRNGLGYNKVKKCPKQDSPNGTHRRWLLLELCSCCSLRAG